MGPMLVHGELHILSECVPPLEPTLRFSNDNGAYLLIAKVNDLRVHASRASRHSHPFHLRIL
jgi:hypothetical protein